MENNFLMIDYDLLKSNLSGDEKIILSLIKSWNDDNKECFMTNGYIGNLIGLKPKNVSVKINKLKNLGCIDVFTIYRKNTKQVEKRILKFICFPTPPEIVDTPPQKQDTPPIFRDTPPQKREDIILDIKLEDKIKDNNKDNNIITPDTGLDTGEFGNLENSDYICNTNNNEKMSKFKNHQEYLEFYTEYRKQRANQLGIKIEEIPTQVNNLLEKQKLVDLEYRLQNEFFQVDKNILLSTILENEEHKLFLITNKELTSTQKELCENYRKLKKESSTER